MTGERGHADDGGNADDRTRVEVCPVEELPPGSRTIVDVDGRSIGVFNVDGAFHALRNVCPHQLAPLCEGQLTGEMTAPDVGEYELTRQGELVQCPWHGWQFDIETGESVFNPHVRTSTYEVEVEESGRGECDACEEGEHGTELAGDEPPVETYDVAVERSETGNGDAGASREEGRDGERGQPVREVVVLYV